MEKPITYRLDFTDFIPEVKKKLYWEVVISDDSVKIIQRGGPLEPVVLTVKGKDLEVDDWWGWGAG